MTRDLLTAAVVALALAACQPRRFDPAEVEPFLRAYTANYLELSTASSEAEWVLNTKIVEGDETNTKRVETTQGALAKFTGSTEVIEKSRQFLENRDSLERLQARQLETILYEAANNPQTVSGVVKERIRAEAEQTEKLFGFDFQIAGKSVSTNDVDRILESPKSEQEALDAWRASKEVGRGLKKGLAKLVRLRNRTVQALGYRDYFEYQVSDYGMTVEEMMALMRQLLRELRPLYREVHTWARHELARRYGKPVPDLIPAHWLPNRWGQSWAPLVKVEGFDLDEALEDKTPEWVVKQAEDFYVSLGFEPLPASFYDKSSLYPLPPDAPFKKNNHASAWHMDLQEDVRSLMSVEANSRWYETTHHELGHIYYYLSYSHEDCPPLLRAGANRAFHEAVGSLLGMASMHKAFLQGRGLLPADARSDETQALLKEALDFVVFNPFSAGTMTHFEHDLYAAKLPESQYNRRWWEYVRRFQGIAPPQERGEEYCDAATKTHINNDAAQYYDYTLSQVILHQIHAHIARHILKQDPRNTNYHGSRQVGSFLRSILRLGATRDWRELMQERLGEEISARAMLEYFAPLLAYLKEVNRGRKATLPEL
ncbi:MAG: M2 family metallopeptidase [Planctomycetota bacterium]|nr:M2 family metallopeptidase [Planctomycetota bacterium]